MKVLTPLLKDRETLRLFGMDTFEISQISLIVTDLPEAD